MSKTLTELKQEMAERALAKKDSVEIDKEASEYIQNKVDDYIELDEQIKKLSAELKELREIIEPYMISTETTVIKGSYRGSISLKPRNNAIMNSVYTSYDLNDVNPFLDAKAKRKCVVRVIDKDILESLVKSKDVSQAVLQFKKSRPTMSLTVSHK